MNTEKMHRIAGGIRLSEERMSNITRDLHFAFLFYALSVSM